MKRDPIEKVYVRCYNTAVFICNNKGDSEYIVTLMIINAFIFAKFFFSWWEVAMLMACKELGLSKEDAKKCMVKCTINLI